jgi:hypothetical protein
MTGIIIQPTPGRVVWYHPDEHMAQARFASAPTLAAIVAFVHSDRMVNLTVLDALGNTHSRTSVLLVQDGDTAPDGGEYCEWMPYQKGQAAKAEALEAKVGAGG